MPQFRFSARNSEGKLIEGVLTSNDRSAAIRQIEQEKCTPIKIALMADTPAPKPAASQGKPAPSGKQSSSSPAKNAASSSASPTSSETLGTSHLHLFTEQLAHLLQAGMTLDEALGILEKRLKHPKLGSLSKNLHQALVDGRSLSQALREYPRIFNPLYVNMVAAGEASGALPDILKRLVIHLADLKALRDRVTQALVYPALLVFVGTGLIIVFIKVMVPQLMGFFEKTGLALPPATQALLGVNKFLTDYWWAMIMGGGLLVVLFKALTRSPDGRHAWDAFVWKIPVFSGILRYRFYAQFARTLGTLMENGVTLLRALELLEEIAGNEFIRRRLVDVSKAVVDGATLSNALTIQKIFPELFIDMMAVGEQTGKFGSTMNMIADIYERELDKQVKITSALIPPLVMLVIAAVVGLVVFAILSAVFNLTAGLHPGS